MESTSVYVCLFLCMSWLSPGISLKGMMLKLKLQYFGHLMWRVDSLEKILMLGGIGGRRRRGRQRMRWLNGTWVWMNSGSGWWTGRPGVLRFIGSQRVRHDWVTELNWWLSWEYLEICYYIYHIEKLKGKTTIWWSLSIQKIFLMFKYLFTVIMINSFFFFILPILFYF